MDIPIETWYKWINMVKMDQHGRYVHYVLITSNCAVTNKQQRAHEVEN